MNSHRRNIFKAYIDPYPGFWLNCIGIILAILVIHLRITETSNKVEAKFSTINKVLVQIFSEKISGTKNLNNAEDKTRISIQQILFDRTEEALEYEHSSNFSTEYDDSIKPFVESLQIRSNLTLANPGNFKELVDGISMKIKSWLLKKSNVHNTKKILMIWIIFSVIYLFIVAISYFGGYLSTAEGEPVFNIIDLGIYLSLVEYSGGLNSPVTYILSTSIIVAILDFTRIVGTVKEQYLSLGKAIKVKGWLKTYSTFAPTIIYTFALMTGLVWASLDESIGKSIGISKYSFLYAKCLLTIVVIGIVAYMFFKVFNSLITRKATFRTS